MVKVERGKDCCLSPPSYKSPLDPHWHHSFTYTSIIIIIINIVPGIKLKSVKHMNMLSLFYVLKWCSEAQETLKVMFGL